LSVLCNLPFDGNVAFILWGRGITASAPAAAPATAGQGGYQADHHRGTYTDPQPVWFFLFDLGRLLRVISFWGDAMTLGSCRVMVFLSALSGGFCPAHRAELGKNSQRVGSTSTQAMIRLNGCIGLSPFPLPRFFVWAGPI
jgi:hypothetical protein